MAGRGSVRAGQTEHLLLRLVVKDLDLRLLIYHWFGPADCELGRAGVEVYRVELGVEVAFGLDPAETLAAGHVPMITKRPLLDVALTVHCGVHVSGFFIGSGRSPAHVREGQLALALVVLEG